ncbi:MAG: nitrite/sulfite reductase [Armatimonadetes bacterium]|nr:nitrite/sulfite reductase [Armatimonadota bacterium]
MSAELERARQLRQQREQRPVTLEEALRRNSVERLKLEKHPLDILEDLPRFIEMPYEAIPEDDILRLQWYGLYHDKPKVGHFMMRAKLPNGMLTPQKLRTLGEISLRHGRGSGELTTRQDIQIHWLRLEAIPEIFATLAAHGMTTAGGCGDNLRNITGCPVAGIDPEELFDCSPIIRECARYFYGNRAYGNLPRKHKHTISACPYHCNAPEIHDIALVGTRQDGQDGWAVWVGGGLSSVPRIGRSLGVFVPVEETLESLRALMDAWQHDPRWRMSRAKARFKFMVDDYGAEKVREMAEERLGRRFRDLKENPQPKGSTGHLGIHPQRQAGLCYIGFPCFPGLISGEQMVRIAEVAESTGGEIRLTREQNFILTHVPAARVDEVVARVAETGFPLDAHPLRGNSVACTGDPYCNFSVGETKEKLVSLVQHIESRFGERANPIHLYLDGCPHACGQHWVGDLGFQGTTRTTEQGKIEAFDIILRGGLGREAGIGRPILRRIPADQVEGYTERLLANYFENARPGESIAAFFTRHSDEEIVTMVRVDGYEI